MTADSVFHCWWVLTNSMLYYAEIDFLIRFTGAHVRKYIPSYVLINAFITVIAIWTQMFQLFSILHIIFMFLFFEKIYKISPKNALTPAVIIVTLSTFAEGFTTVFMRFLSLNIDSQTCGLVLQLLLPAGLTGLCFLELRFIAKRYLWMNRNIIFSYLYVLLLPCTLMIVGIRTILGLDSDTGPFSHGALIRGELLSALYATLWMVGALLVFFIIIEVFHKITELSQQEMEQALLASQIKVQRGYIEETRQRNEEYRSFQHDINNHLLVLLGLLHTKEYNQAETYLSELGMTADGLSAEVSTGNSVLDVLLWEKIRFAKQAGISVVCDVQIPKESVIDDIDLCILFSNGIDNAINACMNAAPEYRRITLIARPKRTFLLINMVNGIDRANPFTYGTGLKNIKFTVEKYAGAMHTEQKENEFSLSILLCSYSAGNQL